MGDMSDLIEERDSYDPERFASVVNAIRRGDSMTDSGDVKVWTYFGDSTNMLEHRVQDLIDRGGKVLSLAIGYGPSPARVDGQRDAPEGTWHAMVVVDASGIDPNL